MQILARDLMSRRFLHPQKQQRETHEGLTIFVRMKTSATEPAA
jgi:hypothetical protein